MELNTKTSYMSTLTRFKTQFVLASVLVATAVAIACGGSSNVEYSAGAQYEATIKTSKGDIEADLYNDIAAIYVENFVTLATTGFYDGSPWHRVEPNFVIQGGTNAAGLRADEFNDKFHPDMRHDDAGILSMANRGLNTNTSQFFITHGPTPHLDPFENGQPKPCGTPRVSCHAVFGKVTSGMDVVLSIVVDDVIETIEIRTR